MNKITLGELTSQGYVIVDEGYDLLTSWIVVDKDGIQFYYYLTTQTLEKIK